MKKEHIMENKNVFTAVAVIVGGPNKCSTMTPEWMRKQLESIFTGHKPKDDDGIERVVLQVVEVGEYRDLRELADARDECEALIPLLKDAVSKMKD